MADVQQRVRVLLGNHEDEPIFMGAVSYETWELWDFEEAQEWADNLEAEFGITDTREADLTLSVPADLFAPPKLKGRIEDPTNG